MSERMVIVIEYEVITGEQAESRDYRQRALTGAMTQIREGADCLDPNHVKVVGVHVGVEDFVDRVLALFAKDAGVPSKADSSPVETIGADSGTPEQPPTNESPHLAAKYWRERQEARAEIERVMDIRDAEIDRLNRVITRVLVLIAPETCMAAGRLGGDRYFCESDIRAALEGKP